MGSEMCIRDSNNATANDDDVLLSVLVSHYGELARRWSGEASIRKTCRRSRCEVARRCSLHKHCGKRSRNSRTLTDLSSQFSSYKGSNIDELCLEVIMKGTLIATIDQKKLG